MATESCPSVPRMTITLPSMVMLISSRASSASMTTPVAAPGAVQRMCNWATAPPMRVLAIRAVCSRPITPAVRAGARCSQCAQKHPSSELGISGPYARHRCLELKTIHPAVVSPPISSRIMPVMKLESASLARNTYAGAISSGCAGRPIGESFPNSLTFRGVVP
jgi:hypothetical protein